MQTAFLQQSELCLSQCLCIPNMTVKSPVQVCLVVQSWLCPVLRNCQVKTRTTSVSASQAKGSSCSPAVSDFETRSRIFWQSMHRMMEAKRPRGLPAIAACAPAIGKGRKQIDAITMTDAVEEFLKSLPESVQERLKEVKALHGQYEELEQEYTKEMEQIEAKYAALYRESRAPHCRAYHACQHRLWYPSWRYG